MRDVTKLLIFLIIAGVPPRASAEAANSRFNDLKLNCDTCHGVGGHSPTPDQTPSLAGKNEKYIVSKLKAFESGKRRHQTMNLLGGSMTNEEMKALARYYSRSGK